ncbi:MAG: prolyl oligopeptidase family serine peptidase [Ignavibacteriae bacterium]|nr:prolyl oligopeptidase family serine peptidase [Ignavibacteriota bacterium]
MQLLKYFLISILFITSIFAQNKNFTMVDVVQNSYYSLAPKRLKQLSWIPNTNTVSQVVTDSTGQNLLMIDAITGKSKRLTYLENINSQITATGIGNKLRGFPRYTWQTNNSFTFWQDSSFYLFDVKTNSLKLINSVSNSAANKSIAPNNKYVAFTDDNNLSVVLCKSEINKITNEESSTTVSGTSVHRNEFGITKGIFWSPKSNYIAFYQKDESMVTDYPLVDIGTAPAKLKNIKYPMAGQKSHHVKVGIYNIKSGKTIWLETGEPLDQYLTNLTWSPNEKHFYIAHLNRDQNHMRLVKYDVETGKQIKVLFEEKDNEYVEPEYQLHFLPNSNNKFLWFSERNNWQHLYLYNTEGNLLKQVTKGSWEVQSILGFDKDSENIFISATKESPLERHTYKVNLKTGKMLKLTKEPGTHRVTMNKEGSYFIDSYNSSSVPGVTKIIDGSGNTTTTLLESKNPIAEYSISNPEIFSIKGGNDFDLYCRLIKPTNFDKDKKYPVVVYVYGGPHAQLVTNRWLFGRYDFWFQYMAQNGYVVFTIDNRGSGNRGLEFEQEVFRKLGTKEIEDQLLGIEHLKTLSYVDSSRIGVFGWSYGGFMTTALMLRTNDTYKVGVGGGAVTDWKLYEIMYGERYMDTPETNLAGYKEANLLNHVENLNGKLLLVHGTSDPTVVWEHTLEFAKKAANLNKQLDYYPYVGHGHGVRGKDAIHLYNKISNYFFDNL